MLLSPALRAGMAELADAADSKSADLRVLGVRLPLPAPLKGPALSPHQIALSMVQQHCFDHLFI